MRLNIALTALLPLVGSFHGYANSTVYPATVASSLTSTAPYRDAGIVYSYGSNSSTTMTIGSGYLVNKRVVITAAHVLFDKKNLTWNTHNGFNRAYNDVLSKLPGNYLAGSIRLNTYSKQVELDQNSGYTTSTSSFEAFNADIAAIYALKDQASVYGSYSILRKGKSALASEGYNSMLLGYPVETNYIASSNRGKMFRTGTGYWPLEDYFGNNDGLTLVYTNTATPVTTYSALYMLYDVMQVYAGNSGGPFLVYDPDEGKYVLSGVLTGTGVHDGQSFSSFRVLDETAGTVIREAMYYSGSSEILNYPKATSAEVEAGIQVTWDPVLGSGTSARTTTGNTGWEISRNDGYGWTVIGTVAAGSTSFLDTSAENGIYYNYKVRAVSKVSSAWTNEGPWSKIAAPSSISTKSDKLAIALKAPYICLTSGGDAPFVANADGSGISSGEIVNNGESWIKMTVYGPGVLSFTWASDCEAASSEGVTDYASVYVEGASAPISTISGKTADAKVTVNISKTGPAEVVVKYKKDDFAKSGTDRVVVNDMKFFYSGNFASLPGGAQTSGHYFSSPLIDDYYDFTSQNWIYDAGLGYVYINKPASQSEWESNQTLWLYLNSNPDFGWSCAPMEIWPWMWNPNKGWIYYIGEGWFWVQKEGKSEKL